MNEREYTVLLPFGGSGFGALGFKWARARLFEQRARFRVIGGIDVDPLACKDFARLVGAPSLCMPIEKMTPTDLRAFAGDLAPDVVFMSPPCVGASGLLSEAKSKTAKYRALNGLALTWTRLMLATWKVPPKIVLLENVPRLKTRAAGMLRKIRSMLHRAGYVFHEGFHDCGELGGLAQHRRRFLLVARHAGRVAPLLYQPPKMCVRACGEVLGELPLPADPIAGAMHVLPRISWLNWVRLALIPAGGDWRDLPNVLEEGQKRREKFKRHAVERWEEPVGTVGGSGSNGVENVADPRPFGNVDRVTAWTSPAGTVTSSPGPSSGAGAVADPRVPQLALPCLDKGNGYHNNYRVEDWKEPAHTVTGATRPGSGAPAVADPRARGWFRGTLGVAKWDAPCGTITGNARASTGKFSVADPRVGTAFDHGYGVLPWSAPSSTVAAGSYPGQGAYSVADPRVSRRTPGGIDGQTAESGAVDPSVLGEGPEDGGLLDLDGNEEREWLRSSRSPRERDEKDHPRSPLGVGDARRTDSTWDARAPRVRQPIVREARSGTSASRDARSEHGRDGGATSVRPGVAETEHEARERRGSPHLLIARKRGEIGQAVRRLTTDDLRHPQGSDEVDGYAIDPVDLLACVADPRKPPREIPIILAADGTWHRPLTTLELAALQGVPTIVDGAPLVLAGTSQREWRRRIGNGVPPPPAQKIGEQMLITLLQSDLGAFSLSSGGGVWVERASALLEAHPIGGLR